MWYWVIMITTRGRVPLVHRRQLRLEKSANMLYYCGVSGEKW